MSAWKRAFGEGALAGSLASLLSAGVLLWSGARQQGRPAGPVNAVSHWAWGDSALRKNGITWRHTALGYLIHHAASLWWSTLHARLWRRHLDGALQMPEALLQSSATAAAACFVDLQLVPRRFAPGFEHRLTRSQMGAVYGLFALGLAVGMVVMSRQRHRMRE